MVNCILAIESIEMIKIKYYLLRWFVCWLAVIDHIIGILTFGIYHSRMATSVSVRYFGNHFGKKNPNKYIHLGWPDESWEPGWYYSEAGDCIFAYFSNEAYYAKWLNNDITVYISQETGKPIGVFICNIRKRI